MMSSIVGHSEIISLVIALLALGGVAGFLAGLLGIGGGTVVVPGLFYVFHYLGYDGPYVMHQAIGTSLATIAFTGISSSRSHWKRGAVDFHLLKGMGIGIAIGSVTGAVIADHLSGFVLALIFATLIAGLAVTMAGKAEKFHWYKEVPGQPWRGLAGFTTGNFSSMIGIGGASFNVPYMCLCGVPVHRAIGTAAALGLFVSIPGAISFVFTGWSEQNLIPYSFGFLNVPSWLIVISMSVLTAPLGARVSHAMPVNVMRKVFAAFKVIIAVHMLWEIS
jgi:uncharacterized membrane protein YfcA